MCVWWKLFVLIFALQTFYLITFVKSLWNYIFNHLISREISISDILSWLCIVQSLMWELYNTPLCFPSAPHRHYRCDYQTARWPQTLHFFLIATSPPSSWWQVQLCVCRFPHNALLRFFWFKFLVSKWPDTCSPMWRKTVPKEAEKGGGGWTARGKEPAKMLRPRRFVAPP